MTDFAAVDAGDPRPLVAMMDATDAWAAVRAARAWVIGNVQLDRRSVVVDVGCGPGTFGAAVPGIAVDIDASAAMVRETRNRRLTARGVVGDVARLPIGSGRATLVHCERVLQWAGDPASAVAELGRITARGGWLALTDTDWSTFAVAHPDPAAAARLAAAAPSWVPHGRLARELPALVADLASGDVRTRRDTVIVTEWNPDAADQSDGPPGLPLRSIAGACAGDLLPVADRARRGQFRATVELVTVLARRA